MINYQYALFLGGVVLLIHVYYVITQLYRSGNMLIYIACFEMGHTERAVPSDSRQRIA